jgi:hypothetical protein
MVNFLVTNVYNGLNLRPTASTDLAPLAVMPFGTELTLLEDTGTKWKRVRITSGGPPLEGFASDKFLTVVKSDAIARLIKQVAFHWELFDRGKGKEDIQPFKDHVLKMWDDLPHPRPPGNNTSHDDFPWSAAGVSAFIRRAGGYDGFKFAAGHSVYIHDSIVKMKANKPAPFWGFRIGERKPEVGDLVAQWRKRRTTYDEAARTDGFRSHTDVVCQIVDGTVRAIGANVENSVGVKVYRLTPEGFLAGSRNEIAIMENRAA